MLLRVAICISFCVLAVADAPTKSSAKPSGCVKSGEIVTSQVLKSSSIMNVTKAEN